MKQSGYQRWCKRPLDILCAVCALVVFGWLYILLAVLVWADLGTPILFLQERPGKDERVFTLLKFRTMADRRDAQGNLLPDGERLTALGRFLRRTSLDELPQVWNILKGEMSVVGPRPLLVRYLPYYTDEERHRHDVRPGLTGLAQVSGRNDMSWEERFETDVRYVRRVTFWGDMCIVLRTVKNMFRAEKHVNAENVRVFGDFDEWRMVQGGAPFEKGD